MSKVLVLGDTLIDDYRYGSASRISPEAPFPVVLQYKAKQKIGGAGNCASMLSSFGCETELLVADTHSSLADVVYDKKLLVHYMESDYALPRKMRVIVDSIQTSRLDVETVMSRDLQSHYVQKSLELIPGSDLVILSDYAKGSLNCVRDIIELANRENVPVLVDPKGNDFSKYAGAYIIKPNRNELNTILSGALFAERSKVISNFLKQNNIKYCVVTLGSKGFELYDVDGCIHFGSKANDKVADVTGAGDVFMSMLGCKLSEGCDIQLACDYALTAADISVRKPGTYTPTVHEVEKAFTHSKEVTVFTNGCFDILHLGHLKLLEYCASIGSHVIVGLNSDASVRRLKGDKRPINDEKRRLDTVKALPWVDDAIIFDEDTPLNLIKMIKPDILVKGGDYNETEIVGYDWIYSTGGRVEIFPTIEEYSTSNIVKMIRDK